MILLFFPALMNEPKTKPKNNAPGTMNMELKKWYMDDGKGQVKTISSELKEKEIRTLTPPQESVRNDITRRINEGKITLDTLEPVWRREEPKNCFHPF